MSNIPKISIIILNYNTEKLLKDCLASLKKVKKEVNFEVIVSDNGSTDGSLAMVRKEFQQVKIVENKANLGFAKGNNMARHVAKGKFILFLNTDTIVKKGTLAETAAYLEQNKDVGAITCKLVLADGSLDKDARRSFPTPWVSLTHLVLKLDKIFPKSKLFARYWYGYISSEKEHEVDVIQGAYFLVWKKILDSVGWFDEAYFLDGEDIDLCWKIKKKGWKIVYYPQVSILHLKGATKGKTKKTAAWKVPLKEKMKFRMSSVNSMEIFYRKRMWANYPLMINFLVILGIRFVKLIRLVKIFLE
jgi:hypothetical protein